MPSMEEHVRARKEHIQVHGIPVAEMPVAPVERAPHPEGQRPPGTGVHALVESLPLAEVAARPAAIPGRPDMDAYVVLRVEDGPMQSVAGVEWELREDYANLPERFRASLQALVDAFDAGRCWKCGAWVGYYLDGDADEITRWHPAFLVDGSARDDGHGNATVDPVSWQCELCAPDTAAQPWPTGQAASWWPADLNECASQPDGSRRMHVVPVGATSCRCGQVTPTARPTVAGQ